MHVKPYKTLMIVAVAITIALVIYMIYRVYSPVEIHGETIISDNEVLLPLPAKTTTLSIEEAILYRRSIREYTGEPITIKQLSMILWSAQGITNTKWRFRAAPSAGATYPIEVYVVVGKNTVLIDNNTYLKPGIYKYNVYRHSLVLVKEGDYRRELMEAALNQKWVGDAAVDIVLCAVYERTTSHYGERGIRYVHIEVGHIGQNIYLMATSLGLGTVAVGAFHDDRVASIIGAEQNEHPVYIMPVGVPVRPYRTSFEEINSFYKSMRG